MNLKKFATNFVSSNSFHLNGDQKGGQYSDFTYRPFILEGNFAFAQGIHEMLLQSHKDFIEVFPAIPTAWKNVSFKTLRAEGAFLISAKKENGLPLEVKIKSEAGGILRIKLPFKTWISTGIDRSSIKIANGIAEVKTSKGQTITFKYAFE
jgi:alpha-L-fucosidase 2